MAGAMSQDRDEDVRAGEDPGAPQGARRRRGRPLEMTAGEVLERIRHIAAGGEGLFRVHRTHSDLYARARRLFGSWAAAVIAAGVDYQEAMAAARRRARETRRGRGKRIGRS